MGVGGRETITTLSYHRVVVISVRGRFHWYESLRNPSYHFAWTYSLPFALAQSSLIVSRFVIQRSFLFLFRASLCWPGPVRDIPSKNPIGRLSGPCWPKPGDRWWHRTLRRGIQFRAPRSIDLCLVPEKAPFELFKFCRDFCDRAAYNKETRHLRNPGDATPYYRGHNGSSTIVEARLLWPKNIK